MTEEDALQYIGERTNEMLALCDKYNFDGIIADYTGRSLVSLPEAALKEYNGRQQKFFGEVMNWQSSHDDQDFGVLRKRTVFGAGEYEYVEQV